ncbi:MAG: hypothetical protein ABSE16_06040 [Verrucomicrobiota bacterium]|jgi:hypothetical protein
MKTANLQTALRNHPQSAAQIRAQSRKLAVELWQRAFGPDPKRARRRNLAPLSRIELALKLEPLLREKAREKQINGGKNKVPNKCAEAPGQRETRTQIAKLAGVSTRLIDEGKTILAHADEETKK